jgi:peptidoglycan/LPS O-acetylase OafA/YrhL
VTQSSQAPQHVDVIDVIRGFAALSVVLLHLREIHWIGMRAYSSSYGLELSARSLLAYLSFPVVWGSIGVPIFFVISGYVIHRSGRRSLGRPGYAGSFWLRRGVRIYPTLIAALALTWLCDTVASRYGDHEKFGDLSAANLMANMLAVVGVVGSPYGSNGALWSLSIELQFYLVYPAALLIWGRIGPKRMLLLTMALSVVGYLVDRGLGVRLFLAYYFSWWLGAYVADTEGVATSSRKLLAMAAAFIGLGCATFLLKADLVTHNLWSVGFAALLKYLLARKPKPAGQSYAARVRDGVQRAFAKVGDFSYSLYAVHLPVAVAFSVIVFDGEKQHHIGWMAPSMVVVLLVAYGVYRAVEVPSMRALQRMPR